MICRIFFGAPKITQGCDMVYFFTVIYFLVKPLIPDPKFSFDSDSEIFSDPVYLFKFLIIPAPAADIDHKQAEILILFPHHINQTLKFKKPDIFNKYTMHVSC